MSERTTTPEAQNAQTPRENGESGDLKKMPLDELGKSGQARPVSEDAQPEDGVDAESVDSFPASDPPAR